MTGAEEDRQATAVIERLQADIIRETHAFRRHIQRMANAVEDTLTELNDEFEVEFGWSITTPDQFVFNVKFPKRSITPAPTVAKEAL